MLVQVLVTAMKTSMTTFHNVYVCVYICGEHLHAPSMSFFSSKKRPAVIKTIHGSNSTT